MTDRSFPPNKQHESRNNGNTWVSIHYNKIIGLVETASFTADWVDNMAIVSEEPIVLFLVI